MIRVYVMLYVVIMRDGVSDTIVRAFIKTQTGYGIRMAKAKVLYMCDCVRIV